MSDWLKEEGLVGVRPFGLCMQFLDLSGANMIGANLYQSRVSNCDLSYADLRNADLRHAIFENVNLTGANFSGARRNGGSEDEDHWLDQPIEGWRVVDGRLVAEE